MTCHMRDSADKRAYRSESDAGWLAISLFCVAGLVFWWLFARSIGWL